jgi:hypothetical protein
MPAPMTSTPRWTGWPASRTTSRRSWPAATWGRSRTRRGWRCSTCRPPGWKARGARWPPAATSATARKAGCRSSGPADDLHRVVVGDQLRRTALQVIFGLCLAINVAPLTPTVLAAVAWWLSHNPQPAPGGRPGTAATAALRPGRTGIAGYRRLMILSCVMPGGSVVVGFTGPHGSLRVPGAASLPAG